MVKWVESSLNISMWKALISKVVNMDRHYINRKTCVLQQKWGRPLELLGVDSSGFKQMTWTAVCKVNALDSDLTYLAV